MIVTDNFNYLLIDMTKDINRIKVVLAEKKRCDVHKNAKIANSEYHEHRR